jgi:hypothetical protein
MPEKLEKKAERPKILNDKFRKKGVEYPREPRLHDYFIASIQQHLDYLENFQKNFHSYKTAKDI